MRILVLTIILILVFIGTVFADNAERILEIQKQSKHIENKIIEARRAIEQLKIQLIKNQGKIDLLRQLDAEIKEAKKEVKEDAEKDGLEKIIKEIKQEEKKDECTGNDTEGKVSK